MPQIVVDASLEVEASQSTCSTEDYVSAQEDEEIVLGTETVEDEDDDEVEFVGTSQQCSDDEVQFVKTSQPAAETTSDVEPQMARPPTTKRQRQDAERQLKAEERFLRQVNAGKYAHEEISVIMEKTLHNSLRGTRIIEYLRNKFHVGPPFSSNTKFVIQWAYRIRAYGGVAATDSTVPLTELPVALLYLPADRIVLMAERNGFDSIKKMAMDLSEEIDGRVYVVFDGLENYFAQLARDGGTKLFLPQFDELAVDLRMMADIEVKWCKNFEDVKAYILNVTRCIAEMPYRDRTRPLKKSRSVRQGVEEDSVEANSWLRILEKVTIKVLYSLVWHSFFFCLFTTTKIPGMSTQKAQKMVNAYPTVRSLLDRLRSSELSDKEKLALLEDVLSSPQRKESQLSRTTYQVLTSLDPDAPLSNEKKAPK
jgi:hypothetical protein